MATVSGVWVWVDYFSFEYMDIDESVNFSSNGKSFTRLSISMYDSGTPPITEIINIRYINDSETIKVYRNNSWQNEAYKTIDFGTTEQTVSEDFYSFLTSAATQQAPSVPTPDWANCFVKTSTGNKAVEKVWIKQGSSLNVVWEAEETGINGHYVFNDILQPYPTATAKIYLSFTRPPNTASYVSIEFKDSEMWFYYGSGSGSMVYDYNYNPDDDPNGWYGKNQEINITNSSEVDEVFTQWFLANTTKKS